jgi:putative transposase
MRKSRFNDSQRQAIIDSHLNGNKTVEAICEEHQISPATFYKWKNELEVDKNEDKRRIKELESENLRLKKMYAELQLKHEVISDAVDILKKMQAQKKRRD